MKRNWVNRPANDTPGAVCPWPRYWRHPSYVTTMHEREQEQEAALLTLLAMRREGLASPARVLEEGELPF